MQYKSLAQLLIWNVIFGCTYVVKTISLLLSLDINFYSLYGNIFISTQLISAHPHLNAISGGLCQLLVEPWRVVKGAACVERPTASTVPQWIITVKVPRNEMASTCRVTKIVITHVSRRWSGSAGLGVYAGTIIFTSVSFIKCCSKRPDIMEADRCTFLGRFYTQYCRRLSASCRRLSAPVGELSATVGDCRRLSATVGDCRRLSATVGDCRRLSAPVGDCRRLSESCRRLSESCGACRRLSESCRRLTLLTAVGAFP